MHGAAELFGLVGSIGTFVAAFAIHRSLRPRSAPVLVLLAFWPVILLLIYDKRVFFEQSLWWGFYAFVAVMVAAKA